MFLFKRSAIFCALLGCAAGSSTDAGAPPDARADLGQAPPDAGTPSDAGLDAGIDVGVDAGVVPCEGDFVQAWDAAPALPASFESHAMVASDRYAYTIGGWNQTAGALTQVYFSEALPSGAWGPWTATAALPSPLQHHAALVHNGAIYVFGGDNGFGGQVSDQILRATIAADGTLAPWEVVGRLPQARSLHAAVLMGTRVLLLGGISDFPPGGGSPATLGSVLTASFDASGQLGAFLEHAEQLDPRAWFAAVADEQRVYIIGGLRDFATGQISGEVLVAEVDAQGTLQNLRSAGDVDARIRHAATLIEDRLLLSGGQGASGALDSVMAATVDSSNGALGAFEALQPLPEGLFGHGMTAGANRLIVSGGFFEPGNFDTRDLVYSSVACP